MLFKEGGGPLTDEAAEGEMAGEIGLIVDGVLEDVRSGKTTRLASVIAQAADAASRSGYAQDFDLAVDALKYGRRQNAALETVVRLGRNAFKATVVAELLARPELWALLGDADEQGYYEAGQNGQNGQNGQEGAGQKSRYQSAGEG